MLLANRHKKSCYELYALFFLKELFLSSVMPVKVQNGFKNNKLLQLVNCKQNNLFFLYKKFTHSYNSIQIILFM